MRRHWISVCALVLLLAASALARAGDDSCDLKPKRTATVAQVIDAHTVELDGGETVRLAGALPPLAPSWWKGDEPWRSEERAKAALEKLLTGREVGLATSGEDRERDRHNRLLAQLFLGEGEQRVWVQGELAEQGHARAFSLPGSRACVRALQAREARARAARKGIWRDPYYQVAGAGDPDAISKHRFAFRIVEGTVLSVGITRNWTFLNFGPDYKTDFTVAVRAGDRKKFRGSDVTLEKLEGKRIRVRGWVERWNGPVIKATHPEQIELLAGDGPETRAQMESPAPRRTPGSLKL